MEFRILGTLEVLDGSHTVTLGGHRKRATLAVLLLNLNRAVSTERLVDELWGEGSPPTAHQALRVHVSQIRKVLGSDLVRTMPSGYVLELAPDRLDSRRFERLALEGKEALTLGEVARAAALLHEALSLWRGPALADFVYEPFAQAEIARLEELRLAVTEARIDADLALGAHADLVGELMTLVAEHPFRERFRAKLMLALYRAGRQSEALSAFRDARRTFVDKLGIEPSPELQNLERAILNQEPSLDPGPLSPRGAAPPTTVRKTVTVLHVDLGASRAGTQDPEALAGQLAGPLAQALAAVSRHEGAVIAQELDSLTAVFGLPSLHEDDALRAARAGADLRERLAGCADLAPHIGIATGEVVASETTPPVGSVGAAAVRLAHMAQPLEIVLDDTTRRLVANAVEVEAIDADAGYRLRALLPGAPPFARRMEVPLVGRSDELAAMVAAFQRTVDKREPHLLVVVGPPGIGKSRLATELLARVAGRATTLVGRCQSYGQDITLWPLREIVREAAGDDTRAAIGHRLAQAPDGSVVADRIAAALGLADAGLPTGETAWAFRRLFETLAQERPHVILLEDAHWAEPALLDLFEYVARHASGVPLLVVLLARPELLEARQAWFAGAITLGPLTAEEATALVDNLPLGPSLTPEARDRIIALADGNPLFAEHLVALLVADGGDALRSVAPAIHAILAARLDLLGPGERLVAERAAVIGREFTLDALVELLPPDAAAVASRHLDVLTRKMLVQTDRAVLPGSAGFRFQHALVHETAYGRLPKALRAELHERLAGWLVARLGARIAEVEEVVGYHLERACEYRRELGGDADSVGPLAGRAAHHLAAAGRRAFHRTDFGAAVGLLSRALALIPADDPASVPLLNVVGTALGPLGQLDRQADVLDETVRRAARLGDTVGEWQARLERSDLDFRRQPRQDTREALRRQALLALQVCAQHGDALGAARASAYLSDVMRHRGQAHEAERLAEQALAHARAAGARREEVRAQWALVNALLDGPTAVNTAIARCEQLLSAASESLVGTVGVSGTLGVLRAMNGDYREARRLVAHARSILEGIAHPRPLVYTAEWAGRIELLAREPALAETRYREGLDIARRIGEQVGVQHLAIGLAESLMLQGRAEEAAQLLDEVADPLGAGATRASARWRISKARVLALRGDLAEAERLVRGAAALLAPTDLLELRGDATLALAERLQDAGRDEAAAALQDALHLYERKGNVSAILRACLAVPGLPARRPAAGAA